MKTLSFESDPYVFWGKFDPANQCSLPLAAHCLDVALVFRALCDLPGFSRALNTITGTTLTVTQKARLAVLAGLHDLGKANLGFQQKIFDPTIQAGHVRELTPLFLESSLQEQFVAALPSDMFTWFASDENAYSYFLAVFSHHGRPVKFDNEAEAGPNYTRARDHWWRSQDGKNPFAAMREVVYWLRRALPDAFTDQADSLPAAAEFHHRIAGLTMLADWIGSDRTIFPVVPTTCSDRCRTDHQRIPDLLHWIGLNSQPWQHQLVHGPQNFWERFALNPSPAQAFLDTLDLENPFAHTVILEAETGSGKTEAALNWFFRLFQAGKVDALYFALPTRVAASEIYQRVVARIAQWFPDSSLRPVTLLAVPGYPLEPAKPSLPNITDNQWQDDPTLRQHERLWASERPKRFLAATIAVGTVDQALLSTVQTAHAHLRSVCLDRSLLVVDEVHASDQYMSRLLEHLLDHHQQVGGYALLLSATLGVRARQRYTARKTKPLPDLAIAQSIAYPALTLGDGQCLTISAAQTPKKCITFTLVPHAFTLPTVADAIASALKDQARILVVLNTVARVNTLLRLVETHSDISPHVLFFCQSRICPHHGRFAPNDRRVLDRAVTQRLGKSGPPDPVVLIGTQTLEQSLDIDADILITDLAPADVLLQRAGRLHRHSRQRPVAVQQPHCIVLIPPHPLESAIDDHGHVLPTFTHLGYGTVYADLRSLELTRRILQDQPVVCIPQDNRRLVEYATHPHALDQLNTPAWLRHRNHVEGSQLSQNIQAAQGVLDFQQYFGDTTFQEMGDTVTTRLGVRNFQVSLTQNITSPFGQILQDLIVPQHMAPSSFPMTDTMTVESTTPTITQLRWGDRHYQYTRYGLEVLP